MVQIIILLVLSICLVILILFMIDCYGDYREMVRRENNQILHYLQKLFELKSNSLEASEAMMREACRHWEEGSGDDEETEY